MADDLESDLTVTSDPVDEPKTSDSPMKTTVEMAYPALSDYFNTDSPNSSERKKMEAIWEYFSKESENTGDMLYKIRQLENRLASPQLGMTRLQNVFQYITVSNTISSAEKQRDSQLRQ